jgi:hypothetical protein
VNLDNVSGDVFIQIFYVRPVFRINIMHMKVRIRKNNNVPFISDLNNSRLYINNSLSDKLFNVTTFMNSYYEKPKGISNLIFNTFFMDFGNIMSQRQVPVDTLGVPVIKKFKLDGL